MQAFFGTRISEHISKTPEGYLVCLGVPICRTGTQVYRGSEIGLSSDEMVEVYRPPAEVLHPKTSASAEGKPLTDQHPGTFLNSFNAGAYSKGHVQHVRRGAQLPDGEWPLVADLVVTDRNLIEKIERGVREVSCGYDCKYVQLKDGSYAQQKIRINHVAVVPTGRAGSDIRILDEGKKMSKTRDEERAAFKDALSRLTALLEKLVASQKPADEDELIEISGEDPELEANDGVLELVRSLRPNVMRSGDRKSIDAYNRAVLMLRGYSKVLKQYPRSADRVQAAMDAERRRRIQAEASPDTSFGENARRYHRRSAQEGQRAAGEATPKDENRTTDSPEDWAASMNAAGRKLRERKV